MTTKDEILATEFDEAFVGGMRARMATSFYKYGPVAENVLRCDYVATLLKRVALFQSTGNTEWLMDAANCCMIIHKHRDDIGYTFEATTAEESPGLVGTPINMERA